MNVARSTVNEAPPLRVTRESLAHRSIVNSIFPSYPQLHTRSRVAGWVVAFAIALILGSTAFALWAILALH